MLNGRPVACSINTRVGRLLPTSWTRVRMNRSTTSSFARADQVVDRAFGCFERLGELGRVDVAKRVGGEVTEHSPRPMDVLHAPFGVVGGSDLQQALACVPPRLGQIGDRERAADQCELELEAQDDVQVVRDLVRIDTTPAALYSRDGSNHVLGAQAVHARAESCDERRVHVLPERQASPDVVLEEAGLRFVRPQGGGGVEERPGVGFGQSLGIQRVADLVERHQDVGGRVVRCDACGEPHVPPVRGVRERVG